MRKLLRAKAKKRGELRRLVNAWWDAACEGSDQAREQILRRLDPVVEDPTAGTQILTGLKLELSAGKASMVLVRGPGGAQAPASAALECSSSALELPENAAKGLIEGGSSQGASGDVVEVKES